MNQYYAKKLSAERLKKCYDIAPKAVLDFFKTEIEYIKKHLHQTDSVLELGCGYGRVIKELADNAKTIIGIDNAQDSISMSEKYLSNHKNCDCYYMDANHLTFEESVFDKVLCIQNGISALQVSPEKLVNNMLRLTKPGGKIILSSYSVNFWSQRLNWFRLQSAQGLLGEIDEEKTRDGIIICKDGFKATTFYPNDFEKLSKKLGLASYITEVDQCVVFCIIEK
jgi:ubiquinone/menaquinone biosynthesis C-methylase UbiE